MTESQLRKDDMEEAQGIPPFVVVVFGCAAFWTCLMHRLRRVQLKMRMMASSKMMMALWPDRSALLLVALLRVAWSSKLHGVCWELIVLSLPAAEALQARLLSLHAW